MSKNKTWIWEDNKDGDFCNVDSQHEYQAGNLTDAVEAEAEAHDRGEEVIWLDAPVLQEETYEVEAGQKFSRWESSTDSQGVDYQRRK